MKKLFLLVFLILIYSIHLSAFEFLIEAKAAYFHPTGSRFQRIYKNSGIYGAEFTVPLKCNFALFASANYLEKLGRSTFEKDRTKICLLPLDLGLKYFIPYRCVDFYLGLALNYSYFHTHDQSDFVKRHVQKGGFGVSYKGGGILQICSNFFLDFFLNYTQNTIHFHHNTSERVIRTNADVGGLSIGLGVGYKFGCGTLF